MTSTREPKTHHGNSDLTSQQWQTEFAQSLFNGLSANLTNSVAVDSKTELQQRFAIYQNNVFYSFSTALADLYPTIKKLVGEDFFNGTANAYSRANPPSQSAMVNFGARFAEFLSGFEHTQTMPYLVDTARLELARHQAYHATDTNTLDKVFFAGISPDTFERSTVEFHPSLQLIESLFPIFTIWQSNQNHTNTGNKDNKNQAAGRDNEQIELEEPQWVIVVRLEYEVLMFCVDYGTYLLYQGLLNKMSVIEAVYHAQKKHPDIDISSAISLGITNGFFTKLIKKQSLGEVK